MKQSISVIIPCLNEERSLPQLLVRLSNVQSGFVKEVIVVDGGSTDRTVQIAKKNGADVVKSDRKGRARQMNLGAKHATGTILFFLHADTQPPPAFDQLIINEIKRENSAGCFRLRFTPEHPLLNLYAWFTRFDVDLFRFGDQGLFVEAGLFAQSGGFREDLIVMEDQQVVRDLRRSGSFTIIKRPVVTSSRKYEENGVIKLQFIFVIICLLYYFGASQKTLVHLYKKNIRTD